MSKYSPRKWIAATLSAMTLATLVVIAPASSSIDDGNQLDGKRRIIWVA